MTQTSSADDCPELLTAEAELPCSTCVTGRTLAANGFCCRDFRNTLGSFATGVTVLSTLNSEGNPVGMTISSFNSVSLDPPLVLWSLSLSSPNLEAFRTASHYAINVLAADQQHLSDRFASRRPDRFSGVAIHHGMHGVPLLDGCSAWLECSHEAHYPGGDHLIFVGRVERFAQSDRQAPLVFHGGCYHRLDSPPQDAAD